MIKMLLELLTKTSELIEAIPEEVGYVLLGAVGACVLVFDVLGVKELYRIAKELLAEAKERRAYAQEDECEG
jgi:hypothetical protein